MIKARLMLSMLIISLQVPKFFIDSCYGWNLKMGNQVRINTCVGAYGYVLPCGQDFDVWSGC